jgi:glycosyltransferase involved in cell wall biosynthesis
MSIVNPMVSVIIPVYNPTTDLVKAIESVLSESVHLELILVDDGSTTDVKSLLINSWDKFIYIRQSNQGPGAARQRGIQEAKGKYVALLDQDDYLVSGGLNARLKYLEARPYIGGVLSVPVNYNTTGNLVPWYEVTCPLGDSKVLDLDEFCDIVRRCGYFFPNGFLARLSVIREVGGFDSDAFGCDELDLYLKIMKTYPLHFLQIPTFVRTCNNTSANPVYQRRLWQGKYYLVVKHRDWISQKYVGAKACGFERLHDMIFRQCIKLAIEDGNFRHANSISCQLIHQFNMKNIAIRIIAALKKVCGHHNIMNKIQNE